MSTACSGPCGRQCGRTKHKVANYSAGNLSLECIGATDVGAAASDIAIFMDTLSVIAHLIAVIADVQLCQDAKPSPTVNNVPINLSSSSRNQC
jgi:hypothetical protein